MDRVDAWNRFPNEPVGAVFLRRTSKNGSIERLDCGPHGGRDLLDIDLERCARLSMPKMRLHIFYVPMFPVQKQGGTRAPTLLEGGNSLQPGGVQGRSEVPGAVVVQPHDPAGRRREDERPGQDRRIRIARRRARLDPASSKRG
jgi:hypothetical protein